MQSDWDLSRTPELVCLSLCPAPRQPQAAGAEGTEGGPPQSGDFGVVLFLPVTVLATTGAPLAVAQLGCAGLPWESPGSRAELPL